MACGCGGSKKRAVDRQIQRRAQADKAVAASGTERRRGELLPGSTWNGPKAKTDS